MSCKPTLTVQQQKLLGYGQALLKPKPRLTGSQWADTYYYLSPESSAAPGKWKTLPYQVEPIDCMTDEITEQVTWWKSARIGYTKCINIAVAYHVHQNPASILLAQPTEDEALGYAEDEIEPMIRDNDVVSDLIGKTTKKGRNKKEKTAKKMYPGGILELVGAHSPRNFRRRTVRVFIGDEIDGWEQSAGKEGDQISLGKKRTNDFWNRKIILGSSPTTDHLSKIKPEFEKGDQRYYYVPCPHCGYKHKLEFKNFDMPRTEDGDLIEDEVGFFCPNCGSKYTEEHKIEMIEKGEWIATKPFKGHASFHIWAAYSYNANSSWVAIAKEWFEVQGNIQKLKTFTNLVLGETWEEEQGDEIEDDELLERREDYTTLPNEAIVLTCGVDTQDDRLEGEIKAWGIGEESWGKLAFRIEGSPAQSKVWEDLDDIIFSTYKREDGVELRVLCTCIDSGGHFTNDVYKYCKKRESRRVFAIKGANTPGKPIVSRPTTSNKLKVKLFTVGTDTAKELIFSRLKLEEFGEGYMHFNKTYDKKYFQMLTAEKVINTYKNGKAVRIYKQIRARNEALDYTVYNLAALNILNPNFQKIQERLKPVEKKEKQPKQRKQLTRKRGGFVNGWK
ncbi:terminase [Malaciobacter canalis]|uniref:Terminase n=1 Tax=Malaciobacter canalis TaxID=1912871 RepID=A0ABX4LRG0_9BACT|nr:phage terminase large subunit family protein [Malaciobacter canalis]PHO10318.1 terminase [Malaciobacter canalis]QEE32423.1 phage terminase, large subunit [Malaciobacter canalis]